MIGTIDVKVQAHNPNFPLDPVFTFVNSSQSFRIRDVPKRIGNWSITNVFVNVTYPNNTVISKECLLVGGVWVGTVDGCSTSGEVENGFVVTASGIDENNQTVSNYVLGAGNIYVKELDGTVTPGTTAARMYFYETLPTTPNEGDSTFIEGVLNVYDGTQWKPVAQSSNPSYIEDSNGNKIEADLDCHVKNLTLPWTFNGVQLIYTQNYLWNYERNDQKYILLFEHSGPFPRWSLSSFRWNGSEWDFVKGGFVNGLIDETSLYFENFGETATRSIIETNRLALISEVPTSFDKIQDSVGNVINANRNVTKIEFGDYCWQYTTTESSGNIFVMTGTKELSEYYFTERDKAQLSYDNNTWTLKYIFNGTTRFTYTTEGNLTDTDLTFNNNIVIYNFTWKQATTEVSDTVALVSQIPNVHGDYIENTDGDKISADRNCEFNRPLTCGWTLNYSLFGQDIQLNWLDEAEFWFYEGSNYKPSTPRMERVELHYYGWNSSWRFYSQHYDESIQDWVDNEDGAEITAPEDSENISFINGASISRTLSGSGTLALTSEIPTKTSDLTNDSGFITSSYPVKNDGGITKAKAMTEQAYEALQTKDSTTLYVITEN